MTNIFRLYAAPTTNTVQKIVGGKPELVDIMEGQVVLFPYSQIEPSRNITATLAVSGIRGAWMEKGGRRRGGGWWGWSEVKVVVVKVMGTAEILNHYRSMRSSWKISIGPMLETIG